METGEILVEGEAVLVEGLNHSPTLVVAMGDGRVNDHDGATHLLSREMEKPPTQPSWNAKEEQLLMSFDLRGSHLPWT